MNVFYGEIGCKNCQCIRIIIDWGISGSVVFHTLLWMSSTTVIWLKFVPSNWLTCYFSKTRQYASQQQCPNCKTSLVLIFYRIWKFFEGRTRRSVLRNAFFNHSQAPIWSRQITHYKLSQLHKIPLHFVHNHRGALSMAGASHSC